MMYDESGTYAEKHVEHACGFDDIAEGTQYIDSESFAFQCPKCGQYVSVPSYLDYPDPDDVHEEARLEQLL